MSKKHKEKTENNIKCTAKATITDLKHDEHVNTCNISISRRLIAFGKLCLLFAILIVVPLVLYLLSIRLICQIYQIDLMTLKVLHLFL